MREASTPERTEEIQGLLRASNLKTHVFLEREVTKDASDWAVIADLDGSVGVDWEKSGRKFKWAVPSLTPKASKISFTVLNRNAEYSEGSGTVNSGAFDNDTRIRLNAGYRLNTAKSPQTTELDNFTGTESFFHHTKLLSGEIRLDATDSPFTTIYFNDFFKTNGTVKYTADPGYTATGYYIFTKNFTAPGIGNVTKLRITGNDTKWRLYWRSIPNVDSAKIGNNKSTDWTLLGNSTASEQEFSLTDADCQFFQVAVVADGIGSWGDTTAITKIEFDFEDFFENLYKDVFHLDTPSFTDPKAPTMPLVKCKGRDLWKRAVENEINLEDLSAGVELTQLVKDVCNQVNIKFSSTSIADLSVFGVRDLSDGLKDITKVNKVFELIMQIITQNDTGDRYQMFLEYDAVEDENILFLQKKPDTFVADFVFNFDQYESIGDSRKNYDKVFNRITMLDQSAVVDELESLDGPTNFTTIGDKTLTWTGDAIYKQPLITINSGDAVVTLKDVNNTSMEFTITGTTIDVDIEVKGNKFSAASPIYAEWFNLDNFSTNIGSTFRIINQLIKTDAEAKLMARGLIGDFGVPKKEANNLVFPYTHLLLEQNDMNMIWARFVFVDDLYLITGIKYHWDNSATPGDNTIFNLEDSGLNFTDAGTFNYDDVMDYDIGYLYDMGISTPLSTKAEIDAASILEFDKAVV